MKKVKNRHYYIKKGLSIFGIALFIASVVSYRLQRKYSIPRGLETLYYNNSGFLGEPTFKELEEKIDLKKVKIEEFSPDRKNYSIEWKGYLFIKKAGLYQFTTASDDGSVVFIDDILVVDNGGFHTLKEVSGSIFLLPGFHTTWVRYCQGEGVDILQFNAFRQGEEPLRIIEGQYFPSIPELRTHRIEQGVKLYTRVVYCGLGVGLLSLVIWLLFRRKWSIGEGASSSKHS